MAFFTYKHAHMLWLSTVGRSNRTVLFNRRVPSHFIYLPVAIEASVGPAIVDLPRFCPNPIPLHRKIHPREELNAVPPIWRAKKNERDMKHNN